MGNICKTNTNINISAKSGIFSQYAHQTHQRRNEEEDQKLNADGGEEISYLAAPKAIRRVGEEDEAHTKTKKCVDKDDAEIKGAADRDHSEEDGPAGMARDQLVPHGSVAEILAEYQGQENWENETEIVVEGEG